jgi:hypothetical protein
MSSGTCLNLLVPSLHSEFVPISSGKCTYMPEKIKRCFLKARLEGNTSEVIANFRNDSVL